MFIPHVFGGAIIGTLPMFLMNWGWLAKPVFDPPYVGVFLEGFLTNGDWRSIVVNALQLVLAVALYLPFFKIMERQQEAKEKEEAELLAEAKALKEVLEKDETVVEIKMKVGQTGHTFGAVDKADIAKALKSQFGLKLDKRKIQLINKIQALGTKDVPVKLHRDVTAMVKVKISEA